MSFFKNFFSSNTKDSSKIDKQTLASIRKDINQEHQQIVELYTQKNPTSFTSKEIIESIANELGKKPGGVRSILSKAGVYVKQEKLTWKNNKELFFQELANGRDYFIYKDLSEELRNDKEIGHMSVVLSTSSFSNKKKKIRNDKEFLLSTIDRLVTEKKKDEIKYLFEPDYTEGADSAENTLTLFKNDREVLLKAWNSSNPKTRTMSDFNAYDIEEGTILQRDREFMLEAVKENPLDFLYVAKVFRNDSSFLDLVAADDFSDYCDRVHTSILNEKYGDDDDDDDDGEDDEIIEIP